MTLRNIDSAKLEKFLADDPLENFTKVGKEITTKASAEIYEIERLCQETPLLRKSIDMAARQIVHDIGIEEPSEEAGRCLRTVLLMTYCSGLRASPESQRPLWSRAWQRIPTIFHKLFQRRFE